MRSGVRLGIDVGKARIGLARSDLHGMLATPVETVARQTETDSDITRIVAVAVEVEATEVVVGLPINLRGERTPSTEDAEQFARRLAVSLVKHGVSVRLIDERLSTVAAQGQLRQAGRRVKESRSVIDQAAAVVILQHALDSERAQGQPTGIVVQLGDENGDE